MKKKKIRNRVSLQILALGGINVIKNLANSIIKFPFAVKRDCKVLLVVELVEVGDVISVRKSLRTDEGGMLF